jgi:hypothetical protein
MSQDTRGQLFGFKLVGAALAITIGIILALVAHAIWPNVV